MWKIVVMKEWNFVAQKLFFSNNQEISKHLLHLSISSYISQSTVYDSALCSDHKYISHVPEMWKNVAISAALRKVGPFQMC